jgi:hypothetical protein
MAVLSKKYLIDLYAVNSVLKNGDVFPVIRIVDLQKEEDGDKTKGEPVAN